MPDAKEFLQKFPALGVYLHGPEVAALLGALVERVAPAGEVLLSEGKSSDTIYLVWDGQLAVTIGEAPDAMEVGRPGAGAVVGEVSFLDGGAASATLTASAPTHLFTIGREAFDGLRRDHPRAATALLRALCRTIAGRLRSA